VNLRHHRSGEVKFEVAATRIAVSEVEESATAESSSSHGLRDLEAGKLSIGASRG